MNILSATKHFTPLDSWVRLSVFLLKVFPMLPSGPVNQITQKPFVEKVTYPTLHGQAEGWLYRPSGEGRHRAILVCLGVVPFSIDHPQIPRLGEALARAGFAALLYWSPVMRDLRLDPCDVENIAMAYEWLITQPFIEAEHSGLMGTCVGGSFALMAAATARIREHVSFVAAYAPYYSLFSLLQDAASSSTVRTQKREPWNVDPLTRKVLVRSLTDGLEPDEASALRDAFNGPGLQPVIDGLSLEGQVISRLLAQPRPEEAQHLISRLPAALTDRLGAMSPDHYVAELRAPLLILLHDTGDNVIPVGESRRLRESLGAQPGVYYHELHFHHLNPTRLPVFRLIPELLRFCQAVYPLFKTHGTGTLRQGSIKPAKTSWKKLAKKKLQR